MEEGSFAETTISMTSSLGRCRIKRTAFMAVLVVLFLPLRPVPAVHGSEGDGGQPNLTTAIQQVAKQNIPAVVHIEVSEREEIADPPTPFDDDPFFRYFFEPPKKTPKKFERELRGLGTGMIMDPEGHILTNNHVVAGATRIEVILADGTTFGEESVKRIGMDPKTDLAVIEVQAGKALPHVRFGDSDRADVGEWVVAIGHPRGLSQTVTQGIISAKHRQGITDPSTYQDFLQTDAPINPGNSGGPLLNLRGEVIGVNAAISSSSGGFEGIGFAIPSNMAVHVAHELISHGKVERGWMGLKTQPLTPQLAQSFKLNFQKGTLVGDILPGGPADAAGIKRGDIIVALGGKEIATTEDLRNYVASTPVATQVTATVWREGHTRELTVKMGSQEEEAKILESTVKDRLGATVRPLTPNETEKYDLDSEGGVVVVWIDPAGPLAQAGFEEKDAILQIEDEAVDSVEGLAELLGEMPPHEKVIVLVVDHSTNETGFVSVEVR